MILNLYHVMNKLEFRLLKIIIIINKCIDGFHHHPTPTPQDKQAHSQRIGFQVVEFTVVKLTEKLTWRQSDTVYNKCILNQRKSLIWKTLCLKRVFRNTVLFFKWFPEHPCHALYQSFRACLEFGTKKYLEAH